MWAAYSASWAWLRLPGMSAGCTPSSATCEAMRDCHRTWIPYRLVNPRHPTWGRNPDRCARPRAPRATECRRAHDDQIVLLRAYAGSRQDVEGLGLRWCRLLAVPPTAGSHRTEWHKLDRLR